MSEDRKDKWKTREDGYIWFPWEFNNEIIPQHLSKDLFTTFKLFYEKNKEKFSSVDDCITFIMNSICALKELKVIYEQVFESGEKEVKT